MKVFKYFIIIVVILLLIIVAVLSYKAWQVKRSKLFDETEERGHFKTEEVYDSENNEFNREIDENILDDNLEENNKNIDNNNEREPKQNIINIDVSDESIRNAKLKRMAQNFINVFATYSSDKPYVNWKQVKDFIYFIYWRDLEKEMEKAKYDSSDKIYSVWTEALSAEVLSSSKDKAVVLVKTKKVERKSKSSKEEIFYPKVKIYYVYSDDNWLVSNVEWLK